jgi:hypothetical protein
MEPAKMVRHFGPPFHRFTASDKKRTKRKSTDEELNVYREWIDNNRKLQRILREMRRVSARALALTTGKKVP